VKRPRRWYTPKPKSDVRLKSVKLYGGPLDGRIVQVPASEDSFVAVFFTYTFAGKDGRQEMFAIQEKSRAAQKFIRWYVGKHSKDPRVEAQSMKPKPVRVKHEKKRVRVAKWRAQRRSAQARRAA
jgi:hypothetical protein